MSKSVKQRVKAYLKTLEKNLIAKVSSIEKLKSKRDAIDGQINDMEKELVTMGYSQASVTQAKEKLNKPSKGKRKKKGKAPRKGSLGEKALAYLATGPKKNAQVQEHLGTKLISVVMNKLKKAGQIEDTPDKENKRVKIWSLK